MAEASHVLRVHPAIGFARVGNSDRYYLGPETAAGLPVTGKSYTGGIPLNAETLEPIRSSEIRDPDGRLVRQAARFKVFAYPAEAADTYPSGGGEELRIGDSLGGRRVVDIAWTVHVANKKANAYVLENPELGDRDLLIHGYERGRRPPLRNLTGNPVDPNDITRLRRFVIDPGPRSILGTSDEVVRLDKDEPASYYDESDGGIREILDYPRSFPTEKMYHPWGPIDTLGELRTDADGRLIVTGGYGRASSALRASGITEAEGPTNSVGLARPPEEPFPLDQAVDNDGWFDDVSDGPVEATVFLDDGSKVKAHGAWVVTADPAYAPQTLNVVSLWDDIYDTWVRQLNLCPEICEDGRFEPGYRPSFPDQIQPFFIATSLQRWNTNLPSYAIAAHEAVGRISAADPAGETIMAELTYVRDPNADAQAYKGAPLMPLSLGDQGRSFLSPTITQYYLLSQWNEGKFEKGPQPLGPGERLDRDVLMNCLGGRFSPGIDMTFIVRQPELYVEDWRELGCGPFRIRRSKLEYRAAACDRPFLGEGYNPFDQRGLEPGDASKFMSVPWHTDYNSCGTHNTAPNPPTSSQPAQSTLYWSWPAQRPVAVYTAEDARFGRLTRQRYSVRGPGTETDDPGQQGRFQKYIDFVLHWPEVGVVIQATQIDDTEDGQFRDDWYLEVRSRLESEDLDVGPWPMNSLAADRN
jgi:hypothetical protein